jgi:hypothetical protein
LNFGSVPGAVATDFSAIWGCGKMQEAAPVKLSSPESGLTAVGMMFMSPAQIRPGQISTRSSAR